MGRTFGIENSATLFARSLDIFHEIYWGYIISICLLPLVMSAGGNGASDGATRLLVALTFGMGILVLAYAAGHHSGGQINCAVTLSLVLGGQVPWFQGLVRLMLNLRLPSSFLSRN